MSGLGKVFVQVLRAAPAVVALVEDRIGPRKIDQNKKLPAVRFLMVVSNPWAALAGHPEMADTTFQVSCIAERDGEAGVLAEAVRQAVLSSADGVEVDGVQIKSIRLRAHYSLPWIASPDGGDGGGFVDALEFFVQHTIPAVEGV